MKKDTPAVSMLYPNPILIACTYDADGKANAATLAWGGVASSEPPAISIAVQPIRHTYKALMNRRAFTVNLVPAKYVCEADYFGTVSGQNEDKFAVTGLTPVKSGVVDAPYIEEFPYALLCEVSHTIDLGLHTLFIGKVKGTKVDERAEKLWKGQDVICWNAATGEYFSEGTGLGKAFSIGQRFIKA